MRRNDIGDGHCVRPNIVLIMSDQHNPHVMGCSGNQIVETPNIDALARTGVHFTDANCSAPLCVPSRAGFMTARYPSETGVWTNGCVLGSDVPTFAHALGAAGYEAVLCGRMHFCGPDQFHGFEKRIFGEPDPAREVLGPEILGEGYNRTNGQTKYAVEVAGHGRTGFQLYDRMVSETACEFIHQHRDSERPFCLVVGMMLPHNPLICSKQQFDYYLDKIPFPEPIPAEFLANLHPAMKKWRDRRKVDELSLQQIHRGLAAYYGLVAELDQAIGEIIGALHTAGLEENTVVIYCSDHGDMAYEHGMWWKSCFYNGSVQVPLIVSFPSYFRRGVEVASVVSLIDVGPTLLDIAGAEPLPEASGRSLYQFLVEDGKVSDWPDEVFSEFHGAHADLPSCMLRKGPWKLIYYHEFRSYQLFNLNEDPDELIDRSNDPECGKIASELLEKTHSRWSGKRVIEAVAAKRRGMNVIKACGHDFCPHPFPQFKVPDGYNEFDFAQLEAGPL